MKPGWEETVSGQLNTVDRLSDLPDFILHHIISFLDTGEAYRTSILSKRWAHISATNPILEFHCYCMPNKTHYGRYWPRNEVSARLLEYIDARMQKYSIENLRIRTLRLIFPNSHDMLGCLGGMFSSTLEKLNLFDRNEVLSCKVDEWSRMFKTLPCKVDEWLRIAVRNQVAELDLVGPDRYQLPDILLFAKSLKRLDCIDVKMPYYNKAINLASLQTLVLSYVVVEEHMLNHIISSCLLLECLSVERCSGFKTIVIPCSSQLKELTFDSLPEDGTILLETSSLTCFKFEDVIVDVIFDIVDVHWPVMSMPGSLRNLRTIDICSTVITDKDLGKLLPELASLETLRLSGCHRLRTIRISSNQLKNTYLISCSRLRKVRIDAPSLTKFQYNGNSLPAIKISTQASCVLCVHTIPDCLDTRAFFKLKKLMTGLRSCNALEISLTDYELYVMCDDIKFNEEELGDVNFGPPRNITELNLGLYYWTLSRSSVSAFLNGLFWTCHPEIIYFRVHSEDPDLMIQLFMSELEDMVNCLKHPLKRIEFPDANRSNTLESKKVDVQLRLHW